MVFCEHLLQGDKKYNRRDAQHNGSFRPSVHMELPMLNTSSSLFLQEEDEQPPNCSVETNFCGLSCGDAGLFVTDTIIYNYDLHFDSCIHWLMTRWGNL
ncbi:hypothetical protein STEG23_036664 [Scotinomys teguina]